MTDDLMRRRDALAIDARYDAELRQEVAEIDRELARQARGRGGRMDTTTERKLVARDRRDVELDVRNDAERVMMHVRGVVSELRGLRGSLQRRARVLADPSRFEDDREIVESFMRDQVENLMRGAYSPADKLEALLADDELLGGAVNG